MKTNPDQNGRKRKATRGTPQAKPAPRRAARTDATGDDRSPYAEHLLDLCASTPRLQSFTSAIGAAGLGDLLRADGPMTIFAPTDVAFGKLPVGALTALLADKPRLTAFLRHHVIPGRVKAPRVTQPRTATPMFGDELQLTETADGFYVDDARIVRTNIRGSNGVIHAIDAVLDPG